MSRRNLNSEERGRVYDRIWWALEDLEGEDPWAAMERLWEARDIIEKAQ